jgi:hypothetical protein
MKVTTETVCGEKKQVENKKKNLAVEENIFGGKEKLVALTIRRN